MTTHFYFRIFFSLFLAPFFLFAQKGPGTAPGKVPLVNLDFRVMAWSGSVWDLYLDPEAREKKFSVGSHRPSDWMNYSGPAVPFPIFKIGETQLDEEGLEIPRPVAFVQPKASGKWLFLLFKDKNEEGEVIYRCLPVEDQSQNYKSGYLVINLSQLELAVSMNGELLKINPEGRVFFNPKPFEDKTVNIQIAANMDGEWKLKKSNTFAMPETGLTTLFVTKRGDRIWIRRFVDQTQP